jgi:hypothetical protein
VELRVWAVNMSSGYLKGLNVAPGINFIYNKTIGT